jgi:hypothetical protein
LDAFGQGSGRRNGIEVERGRAATDNAALNQEVRDFLCKQRLPSAFADISFASDSGSLSTPSRSSAPFREAKAD